jgi:hypothetical protein
MFELISIENDCMTRYVYLKNCETGVVELCFDDSELCYEGQKDFWFMKVGERYECKILLFGCPLKPGEEIDEDCILCRIIGPMEKLGLYNIIPVESGGNYYYISEKDAKKIGYADGFIFHSTRRDLVQVNDVIIPRFL